MSAANNRRRALLLLLLRRRLNRRKRRSIYVREVFQKRAQRGEYHLALDLKNYDVEYHFKYFRMSNETFEVLHALIENSIRHLPNHFMPISTRERLAVTLRYLATGDSQQTIGLSYRMGKSTIKNILVETMSAIWDNLSPIYLRPPSEGDWYKIAEGFWKEWNFPNCLGALDGKHVVIQAPKNSGSVFFNYKHTFSIVLMAVCDADYCFTLVDIGAAGRQSDGGVFQNSEFGQAMNEKRFNIPSNYNLPNTNDAVPMVFLGDDAFPLKEFLMKPYPGKI